MPSAAQSPRPRQVPFPFSNPLFGNRKIKSGTKKYSSPCCCRETAGCGCFSLGDDLSERGEIRIFRQAVPRHRNYRQFRYRYSRIQKTVRFIAGSGFDNAHKNRKNFFRIFRYSVTVYILYKMFLLSLKNSEFPYITC